MHRLVVSRNLRLKLPDAEANLGLYELALRCMLCLLLRPLLASLVNAAGRAM